MKNFIRLTVCILLLSTTAMSARAMMIADSITDYSHIQGQDNWYYGIYNQTAHGGVSHGYEPDLFQQLDRYDAATDRWMATDSLAGSNNNDYLSLSARGGHPTGLGPDNQDAIIWAVRRYVCDVDGLINIDFDLRKENATNPEGGGITGRIFIDGVEVLSQFVDNTDNIGYQSVISPGISVGSMVDFVIDPTGITPSAGTDGIYSARADGSIFSARISTAPVPEPSTILLLGIGITCFLGRCRSTKSNTSETQCLRMRCVA